MDDRARIWAYSITVGLLVAVGLPVLDWLMDDVLHVASRVLRAAVFGILGGVVWYLFQWRWRRGKRS